jgi:Peptidase family M28
MFVRLTPMSNMPKSSVPPLWAAVLTTAFLAGVSWWAIRQVQPPAALPASAPAGEFSAERAIQHLKVFARGPHPVGTPAHDAVRDYILQQLRALGVDPQVQRVTSVSPRWGSPYAAATVQNILARLPGTANTRAVMLSGHYDSVSSGPGASDDGHAVALELETLRALRAGPRLRDDVIFMFTDAEEGGMLGAKAFVDRHPWAPQVGLVMNFETRGTSGPDIMFETSEGNGKLVREFAAAAPHPVTSSLSYEAYKLLPNDTDLTFYKQAGLPGLGFAYIGNVIYYHTEYDDVAHLDPRSLQQAGDYALALTRGFGNLDLSHLKSADATYFVLPFFGTLVYPASWSLPLAAMAALLLGAVIALGISRRRLSLRGTLGALLGGGLATAAACAAVWVMWSLAKGQVLGFWQAFAGDPYHAGVYRLASLALTVAVAALLLGFFQKRAGVLNLWAGALLFWVLLALATSLTLPGATYLFLWPAVACTIALAILLMLNRAPGDGAGSLLLLWIFALPALVLMAPNIELLFQALTMRMAFVAAFAIMLLLGLLLPCLSVMSAPGRWWLPSAAALVCAGCLIAGASLSGFDRRYPRTDSLYYGLDKDSGTAIWFSADLQEDHWTGRYLGANPQRELLPQFVPFMPWRYLTHEAPRLDLPAPRVEKLQDTRDGASRTLELRVSSPRHAPRLWIYGDERYPVAQADVDGTPIDASLAYRGLKPGQKAFAFKMHRWGLDYFNVPPEGIQLHLRLKGPAPGYRMEVVDQSYGLSGVPQVAPRPDSMIPFPLMMDSVWVRKAYTF